MVEQLKSYFGPKLVVAWKGAVSIVVAWSVARLAGLGFEISDETRQVFEVFALGLGPAVVNVILNAIANGLRWVFDKVPWLVRILNLIWPDASYQESPITP